MSRLQDSFRVIFTLRFRAMIGALRRIWRGIAPVHCWEDRPSENLLEPGATCMLWRGHRGEHEWTLDSEIGVTFSC